MQNKKFKHIDFSDSISGAKNSGKRLGRFYLSSDEFFSTVSLGRLKFFSLMILLIFLVFWARLFLLTVVNGQENADLSQGNRVRLVELEAPRGTIYDRQGQIIAISKKVYNLQKGDQNVQISEDQVKQLEKEGLAGRNFAGDLGKIEPGVERVYLYAAVTAHVLGYVSGIQKEEVQKAGNTSSVQSVGRLGLEETYNEFLSGKAGKKLIEVDASGNKISILGEDEGTPGRDIYTTLDVSLQKVVFEALQTQAQKVGTKRGAAVVSNPATGEILALVSYPSYEPTDIGKSVADLDKPFFDRAIQGVYPPGSIFKVVSSLAGLESGKITADTEVEDTGQFEVGGSKFANWFYLKYGKTDGVIKLQRAIARSNDIFFYRLAQTVGLSAIRDMAKKVGFGQKSGVDLPGEAVGLLPDEAWKRSTYNDNWYLGDTMHLGIGQGFLLATPMQVNMMTDFAAVGVLHKPYLLSKIGGDKPFEFKPQIIGQNLVKSDNLELLRSGMHDACKTGGTGAPFFSAPYDVGCKTGTAEKSLGNPHAWFTVFAPFNNPQISVTVLVEDGGEGSVVAAPVAKQIVDWWMANRM